ncbi:MAG: hypothetical protein V1722_03720 [Candidatus Micrarchaeota archaeon]
MKKHRALPSTIADMLTHNQLNQLKLEQMAKKLGKRYIALPPSPYRAGEHLKRTIMERKIVLDKGAKMHVFGEMRRACVEAAHYSLKEAGFNPQIIESKSV